MSTALTILTKDDSIAKWMDFDLLRSEGIGHISKLSGDLWTDHNLHDPGITILEVLCYALTDLGYRNSLPIEDLLAKKPGKVKGPDDNFFSAAQLLTNSPLTVLDYRKMLMNLDGVRNAWLEPATGPEALLKTYPKGTSECEKVRLSGLYNVILELDAFAEGKAIMEQEGKVDRILTQTKALLHDHRNLCEDFQDIFVLNDEEISITADLEVSADANPDDVMLDIMVALQLFLSPQIQYYTLQEMLAKKKSMLEIFQGRAFDAVDPSSADGLQQERNYGFIDTDELNKIERRTELHASDFYQVIMNVKGVNAIRNLKLYNYMGGLQQTCGEDWCLRLTPRHRPVMAPIYSEFRCFKNGLEFSPDKIKVDKRFKQKLSGLISKSLKADSDLDAPMPYGEHRADLGEYHSIQHEFPLLYRIGVDQLPASAPLELHVKKQQLKGYLLFFDQLLANYLAQLANLRELFKIPHLSDEQSAQPLTTLFSQKLVSVPELDKLLRYDGGAASEVKKPGEGTEILAVPYQNKLQFPSQELRELTIKRFIREFEEGKMELYFHKIDDKNYHYVLKSCGDIVLISPKSYSSPNKALSAGEILNFLGTIQACYQENTPVKTGKFTYQYSFNLVNNAVNYEDYLRQITEKPELAQNRRTRFLNHLLARFAEEFTDYTLLMYAIEGQKREEINIIKDKEFFLANYPLIGHDRGRGFNFQNRRLDNISGLERRVESLLGIPNRLAGKEAALCNMEIAPWNPLYYAEVVNSRGEVIFRGTKGYSTSDEAQKTMENLKGMAKDINNYLATECASRNLFGFQLKDKQNEVVALHPIQYESEEKRDKKVNCIAKMAASTGNCFTKTVEIKEHAYFTVFDDQNRPLFKSAQPYPDLLAARGAWLNFVKSLDSQDSFIKTKHKYSDNFSFVVYDESSKTTAKHSSWYCSSKKRTAAMKKWRAYLQHKNLKPQIITKPANYRWQLFEENKRLPLLESAVRFESTEQAISNYHWILDLAKKPVNWGAQYDQESGSYGFAIREKDGYLAARSKWYNTMEERDKAQKKAQELIKQKEGWNENFLQQTGFLYELQKADEVLLRSIPIYRSLDDAKKAWSKMLNWAKEPKYFHIEQRWDDQWILHLNNPENEVIAESPHPFSTCQDAQQAIQEIIKTSLIAPKFESSIKNLCWSFTANVSVKGANKNQVFEGKLESTFLYNSKIKALAAWHNLLHLLASEIPPTLKQQLKDGFLSLSIKPLGREELELARFKPSGTNPLPPPKLLSIWLENQTPAFKLVKFPERYTYQLLWPDQSIAMTGGQYYDSVADATWAFHTFTEQAADPANYVLEKEKGACRYTFFIPTPHCGPEASHLIWYSNKASAMATMLALAEYVDSKRFRFEVGYTPTSWRPEVHWENLEGYCAPVLVGDPKSLKSAAAEVAKAWLTLLEKNPTVLQGEENDGCFGFVLKSEGNEKILARHPVLYTFENQRDLVLDSAKKLSTSTPGWNSGAWSTWGQSNSDQNNWGFRVVKKGKYLAKHPLTYFTAQKRDEVFKRLLAFGKTQTLPYTKISTAAEQVVKSNKNDQWCFLIREKIVTESACPKIKKDLGGGKIWWQSVAPHFTFFTHDEALDGFKNNFLSILELAREEKNYKIEEQSHCKWKIYLLNEAQTRVAEMPDLFTSEKAACCAQDEQIRNARTYAFFKKCDKWYFHLVDMGTEEDTVLWESGNSFESLDAAEIALQHFIHAAGYPGNYFKEDTSLGRFNISLREVHLESTQKFKNPEAAWSMADEFSLLTDETGAFYTFVSPEDVCRLGFQVVGQDFVLARHSQRYHNASLQEEALHSLHSEAKRHLEGISDLGTGYCKKGNEIFFEIRFNSLKLAHPEVLWHSALGFPLGSDDLIENARQHYYGNDDQPEEYRNFYLTLFEYARHADFYQVVKEGPDQFRLALLNPDGGVELFNPQIFPTPEAAEALANRLIRIFRNYPVLKEEEHYYFQYYSFDEDWAPSENEPELGIFDSGKIIWESSKAYPSPELALDNYSLLLSLLDHQSNYQRITEKDGRYFSIEITNPAAILAVHPLTYCDLNEVQEAIIATKAALDGEGMYLIEHILFRPEKNGQRAGKYLIKTCTNNAADHTIRYFGKALKETQCGNFVEEQAEYCLLPYADPYSFWVTVVLPYWPQRFQNPDFRHFFETTLRRETPAHIALRILWVGPGQMSAFENNYEAWLEALSMEGQCYLGQTQDQFLQFLFEEIQHGGPPTLLDATDKNKQVILDESRLTL